MTKKLLWSCLLLLPLLSFSKTNPILVTEGAISLNFNETKELYYSFDEGDEIVFNLDMIKGRNIKSVEIIELPNKKLFSAFKTEGISNKKIKVYNKGVYLFRFYSTSLTTRACNIKISRLPRSNGNQTFDTGWEWQTVRDTTYTNYTIDSITGYNKIKYKDTLKTLVNSEKIEETLFNKNQRVHSTYNENSSSSYLRVDLPMTYSTPLKEEKIIAWAYWIGVGQESQMAYKENISALGGMAEGLSTMYDSSPLSKLAIGAITDLITPKTGEDIAYWFIRDYENVQKFMNNEPFLQFDQGKGIAAYGKNDRITQGSFYIGLYNDNDWLGLDVEVKVIAVKQVDTYKKEVIDKVREEPIIVKVNKKRMDIHESQIRVSVE